MIELPPAEARIAFCDLLLGRTLRLSSQAALDCALACEASHLMSPHPGAVPLVDEYLERGALQEWIAVRAERGEINWGERVNRCDQRPSDDMLARFRVR